MFPPTIVSITSYAFLYCSAEEEKGQQESKVGVKNRGKGFLSECVRRRE